LARSEARERVRSAMIASGLALPARRIHGVSSMTNFVRRLTGEGLTLV
jgi:hypothetical protein